MRIKLVLLALILGIAVGPFAHAATEWELAHGRTTVGFEVDHLIFSQVEGKFKEFEGTVVTEGDDISTATIDVRIKTGSIFTGNPDRDKHLSGKQFFSVKQYPEMTFKSKSIALSDDKHCYIILGDLTIRGITKTIQLMAECSKSKELANGKVRMNLKATGTVNRFDYDLKWNELMETGHAIVGKDVQINLNVALLR